MADGFLDRKALRPVRTAALLMVLAGALAACASVRGPSPTIASQSGGLRGTDKPYQVNGQWYYPKADPRYDAVGMASWYGYPFHLRRTANGELFDQNLISAAHKTLPLPCIVEVTNLENGRRLRVRVNDRGPFVDGRLIDVSKAAAEQLGFDRSGLTRVRVRYIGPAAPLVQGLQQAAYSPRPAPSSDTSAWPDDNVVAPAAPYGYQTAAATTEPAAEAPPLDNTADLSPAPIASAPPIETESLPSPATYAPQPIVAEAVDAPAASGGFAVQAGAFSSRAAAERVAAQLSDAGAPQVSPIERNGSILYRVTVGAFSDPASAADARARVIASGFSGARVVQAF